MCPSPPASPSPPPRSPVLAASERAALQEGVKVAAQVPCSVLAFLVEQLGLAPEYVESRISTIFLQGEVVDDPVHATLADGSVLALSAALPGLVGATLRKGGFYASMRAGITHQARPAGDPAAKGSVTVKLFNLILDEVGPGLLALASLPGSVAGGSPEDPS